MGAGGGPWLLSPGAPLALRRQSRSASWRLPAAALLCLAATLLAGCGLGQAPTPGAEPMEATPSDLEATVDAAPPGHDGAFAPEALQRATSDAPGGHIGSPAEDTGVGKDGKWVPLPCEATYTVRPTLHAIFRLSDTGPPGLVDGALSWSDCRRPITKCTWEVVGRPSVATTQQCAWQEVKGAPVSLLTVEDSQGEKASTDEPFLPGLWGILSVLPPALRVSTDDGDHPLFFGLTFSSECAEQLDPASLNAATECILLRQTTLQIEEPPTIQGIGRPLPAPKASCDFSEASLGAQPSQGVVVYIIVRSPKDQPPSHVNQIAVEVHDVFAESYEVPALRESQAYVFGRVQLAGCAPHFAIERCRLAGGALRFDGKAGPPCVVPWLD